MEAVKATLKYLVLIGCIGIVLLFVFNTDTALLQKVSYNGFTFYKVDINTYIHNINYTAGSFPTDWEHLVPQRLVYELHTSIDIPEMWNTLFNNMLCMIDWLYFPINLILWLWRIVVWIGKMALSLLGIPNTWSLMQALNWITQHMFIPYL